MSDYIGPNTVYRQVTDYFRNNKYDVCIYHGLLFLVFECFLQFRVKIKPLYVASIGDVQVALCYMGGLFLK